MYALIQNKPQRIERPIPTTKSTIQKLFTQIDSDLSHGEIHSMFISQENISFRVGIPFQVSFDTTDDCSTVFLEWCPETEEFIGEIISQQIVYEQFSTPTQSTKYLEEVSVSYDSRSQFESMRESTQFSTHISKNSITYYDIPMDTAPKYQTEVDRKIYDPYHISLQTDSNWKDYKTIIQLERTDNTKVSGTLTTTFLLDPEQTYYL